MKKDLFSIILLHYNQPRYVLTALDSVLCQNYSNIEFVFADDASTDIDIQTIKEYIDKNKRDNIKNVIYSINEENLGTVKTINNAVKKCSGKYILFFAADDALCNQKVISNFEKEFQKANDNVYMISSQCYMMDINLEKRLETFVQPTYASDFNKFTSLEQYKVFCNSCFLAIGSTAMRRDMFDKFGFFDEKYKFVEDWSYFLYLTRNGGLVKYVDFEGLLHRDGGVSHYKDDGKMPAHVIAYKYDMVSIFENEIIPYLKQFDARFIQKVLTWYNNEKEGYKKAGGSKKTMGIFKLLKMFPNYYIHHFLNPLLSKWTFVFAALKVTAAISVMYIACLTASLTMFKGFSFLFSFASSVLSVLLLASVYLTLALFLIKFTFIALRSIKKFLKERKR